MIEGTVKSPPTTPAVDFAALIRWRPEPSASMPPNRSGFLWRRLKHAFAERQYNRCLTQAAQWILEDGCPSTTYGEVCLGEEADLRRVVFPGGVLFHDTPVLRELAVTADKRLHGPDFELKPAAVNSPAPIRAHVDLTTWLTGDIEYFGNGEYDLSALDYDAVFGLIGLIGEVKVSQFYRRGDKHVVCVHRNDDPELLDDDLSLVEGEDWSTTYSFDTGITASAAARIDGARKWQAGMCKVLVYLQSSYEFCRTRLGLLIVGLLFSRIVLSSENHFIVECSQAYLDETELHTIPAVEFLQMSQQSWTHMPWNLCDESDSDVPRWAADSMKRYLDLHRTALKLLATHSTLHNGNPFQPLGPLPSCVELALERLVGGVDVSQSAADAVAPSETIQTQSASRNQQKRTKASDSLVSASRRHEDNETVDDTKRRRLDVEKSAPRQQQGEGQVKQSSEHNTGAYDDSDSRALHLTDRVGQWRDTVAVHCSPSPSEACGGTPVDSVDSGGVDTSAHAQDAEFNGALEAADMQRSKLRAELESAGVDQPVPYASVDEQVYDMLTVIAARRMVVHLVSSEEMDAVISAIREGLSAKTGP